ncbi:MAG: hypothetical protein AAFQ45_07090 [Pseudomonadota bacterium]
MWYSTAVLAIAISIGAAAHAAAAQEPATPVQKSKTLETRPVKTGRVAPGGSDAQPAASDKAKPEASKPKPPPSKESDGKTITMAVFLDRLMIAESGGRNNAKNPLSTATGPFQFIESTFIDVMQRYYPKDIEGKTTAEVLALRTDRAISRKAAEAYTKENAAILAADGHAPTFPNLRLAYLLGAGAASRVLAMRLDDPVAPVLGRAVIRANPFMARLTAKQLIARAARDIRVAPDLKTKIKPGLLPKGQRVRRAGKRRPARPRIRVRCNLARPSCRRWLALKKRQLRTRRGKRQRTVRR